MGQYRLAAASLRKTLRALISAAPLKLMARSSVVTAEPVTHAHSALYQRGPIEARRPGEVDHGVSTLRALISAAPLKPEAWTQHPGRVDALRALISAAPLKPNCRPRAALSRFHTPRSYQRGPIEAHLRAGDDANERTTPRSYQRGPIEASGSWRLPRKARQHTPRSYQRGPIEARTRERPWEIRPSSLRALISAAPLKRQQLLSPPHPPGQARAPSG